MASVPGFRALFHLHRSLTFQCRFQLVPIHLISPGFVRRLCTITPTNTEPKPAATTENESLLKNLNLMGVDLKLVRQRQPGVLRKSLTNENGLAQFLRSKGANHKMIASVISRYPRSITRSIEHLDQRWNLWRNIFQSDEEIVTILNRSPESFFRSSDNEKLERNIAFLTSLGLNSKDLHRLLTTAPRTFSNSLELNKQMVELLENICVELGGTDPEQFAKTVISRNLYILIRSTKRVTANIHSLKTNLKLSNSELLTLLQGPVADILDLSNEYLKKNFNCLQQKMISFGCRRSDIKKLIISYPVILYTGSDTLHSKLDCLVNGGITMKQIVDRPKVLDYSTQNIATRLKKLKIVEYDFQRNGIGILNCSQKRFDAKMEKISASLES